MSTQPAAVVMDESGYLRQISSGAHVANKIAVSRLFCNAKMSFVFFFQPPLSLVSRLFCKCVFNAKKVFSTSFI